MLRLFYYMPDLKQVRKYWEGKIQYPEQKYTYLSQNNIPKELTTISNTRNKIDQNLEQLKYNNFWTQPYSNFQGKQAVNLANNLTKEATYTAAGELLLGKLAQGVNKLIPKKTNRYKARFDENGQPIEQELDNKLIEEQNKAFIEGFKEIRQLWNGTDDMSNQFTKNGPKYYYLDENIKNRLNNIINFKDGRAYRPGYIDSRSNIGLIDPIDNTNNYSYLGNINKSDFSKYLDNQQIKGAQYGDDINQNIMVKRRTNSNHVLSPKIIKESASHETTHQMQDLYNYHLDIWDDKLKTFIPNQNIPISRNISKYLELKNNNGVDEVVANLWKFRLRHNIGTRDLTTNEANQFINEFKFHFNHIDDNLPKLIQQLAGLNLLISNQKDK